ncbi:ABC transporter permease [Frigoriglobus tundricola]|uniref:Transport permease protein n=1 Tax=Frigoriglobus tundricola TaxID=2774151 RepID=A0A6M5YHI0_9BACT|nr:ABC transporter permease [Frigoriglobus tundricola]QJW92713.1 O-antigen export system, permease protein [Frigoriglobus tundricola]
MNSTNAEIAGAHPEPEEVVLRPGGSSRGYWAELWRYRELFYFLAWRDLKVRYKQTSVGIAWAVLRPLLVTFVFVFVFGRMANLPSPDGVPYPLLVIAGMAAWQFFASVMGEGSNSMLANANLISKVYFPRIIVPSSVVAVALADLGITAVLACGLMAWYSFLPPIQIVLLPLFLLLALAAALGIAFWLSALTVRYRDVRFVVPFLVQFGLYVTPVGFSTFSVPEEYRPLFALNPMVGVIEGFRWCALGTGALGGGILPISVVVSTILLVSGFRYYRATERRFADII